jgi:hypothetical protein
MTDNLAIWSALAKTDPKHTKQFTRGGGFKGTATRPIYHVERMTETFGPCGTGWGFSAPTFQIVNGADGEVAVYCWLTLWYVDPATGKEAKPIPGVGGDFVVKKIKDRLVTDDEAFKKATTDAEGNAMKALGMSADIHMGMFEDSKYVSGLQREFADDPAPARQQTPKQQPAGIDEARQRAIAFKDKVVADIKRCGNYDDLNRVNNASDTVKALGALHDRHKDLWEEVMQAVARQETTIAERAAA